MTDTPYLAEGLPAPRPARDGLDGPYWAAAREHRLVVQRCSTCGTFQWGPEWMCHACQTFDVDWVEVAGRGTIYSWQRPHHPVHPALRDQGPYIVVLVELADAGGIRMVGNLLGDPLQEVVIGTEVEAVFEDHAPDTDGVEPYTLVQWRVATD
ncbi:MAG: OB-fold domain-containing protein [Actinomycetota bacterium]